MPTLEQEHHDDEPTRLLNDAPTLLRIRAAARIAQERIQLGLEPDAHRFCLQELSHIELACTEALR